MRLEVDAGNTLVKWRLIRSGSIEDRGWIESRGSVGKYFLSQKWISSVSELLISSVAAQELEADVCGIFNSRKLPVRIFKARPQKKMCGVEFAYDDVSRLGVDRCLAMIAAYEQFKTGVLVVDCGSAITADLIASSGKHLGGYIFPGFRLLRCSLLAGTKNIVVDADVVDSFSLGTSTEECVDNGVLLMVRSSLLGLIELAESFGVFNVVITGGDGERASSLLGVHADYEKDLVFKGLAMLSGYSKGL